MSIIQGSIKNNASGFVVASNDLVGFNLDLSSLEKYPANTNIRKKHAVFHAFTVRKNVLATSVSLGLSALFSSYSLAITNYNGDPALLTSSGNVGVSFSQMVGSPILSGVVDMAAPPSTLPIASGADITVNYSSGVAPDFVLSGYASVNPSVATETATSSNNALKMTQGIINGNAYTGLAHAFLVNATIDCNMPDSGCAEASVQTTISQKTLIANNNSTTLSGAQVLNVTGDINTGRSEVVIRNGDLLGESPSLSQAQATVQDNASGSRLTSNSNSTNILKSNHLFKNAAVGYSGINLVFGEVRGGESSVPTPARGGAVSQVTANSNSLSSNSNVFSLAGDGNVFSNAVSGGNEVTIHRKPVIAAPSVATSANFQYASATSNAFSNTIARQSSLTSTNNEFEVSGDGNQFGNIYSGKNLIYLTHADTLASTANAYATASAYAENQANLSGSTLVSRGNEVIISGSGNSFGNVMSGYSQISSEHQKLTAGHAVATLSSPSATAISYSMVNNSNLYASDNRVNVSGNNNKFNDLTAGHAAVRIYHNDITGGVSVQNGVVTYADSSLSINAANVSLRANNNGIILGGSSEVTGNIHTGYVDFSIVHGDVKRGDGVDGDISVNLNNTQVLATGNTLSITGEHAMNNSNASIYGGYLEYNPEYKPSSYDVFTGNTLNYNNRTPIVIGAMANFQTYNFSVNPALANSAIALITANHINLGSDLSNVSGSQAEIKSDIYVKYIAAGQIVPNNSEFILMQAGHLEGNGVGYRNDSLAQQGISLVYDVSTFIRGNQVVAVIEAGPEVNPEPPTTDPGNNNPPPPDQGTNTPPLGPEANPQLKALLAGHLAGLMLVTRGADNISDNLLSAISEQNKQRGLVPFVMLSANHSRYDIGSHIKSDSGLLTTGISYQDGGLTTGAFIEHGWGSYKTFHEFENFKDTKSQGRNRFNGFGLYGHYLFSSNWYSDITLRGGRLHTNFSSDDIRHPESQIRAKYYARENYYSLGLTAGHILRLNEKTLWMSV